MKLITILNESRPIGLVFSNPSLINEGACRLTALLEEASTEPTSLVEGP